MEPRCYLCGKTVKELAEEELKSAHNTTKINISLESEISYPYELCGNCSDFLLLTVPKIVELAGAIRFDEKQDRYVAIK